MADRPVIDCGFPGGNVLVEGADGDTVRIRPDLRDTEGDWFYWYFRVRGAGGRTLRFELPPWAKMPAMGPAVSDDDGRTWRWLGSEACLPGGFAYAFGAGGEGRFCIAMPYLQDSLDAFVSAHAANPALRGETLCRSETGRPVEMFRAGRLDGGCRHRVLLACRHHCCEMMASYVLEGFLAAAIGGDDLGRWYRRQVEILAVPMVDKDGVQAGDQGKNRRPHDHNRDYVDPGLYAATRSIRAMAPGWSQRRLHLAMDLHCPYICGGRNNHLFFVQPPRPDSWGQIERLSQHLADGAEGPLRLDPQFNIPFGVDWNTAEGPGLSFASWAGTLPGVRLACTLEVPYSIAGGVAVTPETARAFGRDLAGACRRYLELETD
jgi:hypothetical protein